MSTVLLVEDDIGNQMVVQDIFEFDIAGVELAVVDNGDEALRIARESQPILILMDIRLPGMSGLEVTRQLKGDPATKDVPIWALTAYARKEDREKALAAGCDDHITKPFERAELANRLREFVESVEPAAVTSP